jgi:hypothetical protein
MIPITIKKLNRVYKGIILFLVFVCGGIAGCLYNKIVKIDMEYVVVMAVLPFVFYILKNVHVESINKRRLKFP